MSMKSWKNLEIGIKKSETKWVGKFLNKEISFYYSEVNAKGKFPVVKEKKLNFLPQIKIYYKFQS